MHMQLLKVPFGSSCSVHAYFTLFRYMKRRCQFLEEFPAFNYNQGNQGNQRNQGNQGLL